MWTQVAQTEKKRKKQKEKGERLQGALCMWHEVKEESTGKK